MATEQRSTVVGVFPERRQAEQAVTDLRAAGFRAGQIGFAVRGAAAEAPLGADARAGGGGSAGRGRGGGGGGGPPAPRPRRPPRPPGPPGGGAAGGGAP